MTPDGTAAVLGRALRLSPQVGLRPESFGAMSYHYGTRRLSFLKDPRLAAVVEHVGEHPDAASACRAAGVGEAELATFATAIDTLVRSGMLIPADGTGTLASTLSAPFAAAPATGGSKLAERFEQGLGAPICLTWELTYACNLACVHCLSSSGRRDPGELSSAECAGFLEDLERLGVFYVNVGGGEPTIRADFFDLVEHAVAHHVGVKFSTNGSRITADSARRLAATGSVDVQVSVDGATAEVNDAIRGPGSFATATAALDHMSAAGMSGLKLSVVLTRHNATQLDALESLAARYGAQLRLTRLRPSGRGAQVWEELRPTAAQQRHVYDWLMARGEHVLTGDSFFHMAGFGEPLPGLNMCGAGRVVCLIDPVGDVYACPFTIHPEFRAGSVRGPGGFAGVWRESELFAGLRTPSDPGACKHCPTWSGCRGGCMAAKFFTGLPLDAPDPECVRGHGEVPDPDVTRPLPTPDHSSVRRVAVALGRRAGVN